LLITLPYLIAWAAAGNAYSFGGFLLNPLDGNTYLAKMYEGWRGEWRFTLPYTATQSAGAYLYTFYLGLGHLARLSGIPLIAMYHLARLLGALFLLWALWHFLQNLNPSGKHPALVYLLAGLGLGMGWLAFPFGVVTSDFWVAEAYPFLSAYANPHFVLSLALLVWLLTIRMPAERQRLARFAVFFTARGWGELAVVAGAAAGLGSMSPFALVLGLAILSVVLVIRIASIWRFDLATQVGFARQVRTLLGNQVFQIVALRWIGLILGGAPVVLYAVLAVRVDPLLAAWNTQNVTPAPPAWDLFLSFSPALILAGLGLRRVWRKPTLAIQIVEVWAVLACGMVYLPFGLQRRFLVGLAIPLTALASFGLEWLEERFTRRFRFIAGATLALSAPTLLLILLAGGFGALSHDSLLYLQRGEAQALAWMGDNTDPEALVLAAPQTGLFIPSHTGRRVIYGHPFETVEAKVEQAAVSGFFVNAAANPQAASDFLKLREINYIFYGPREQGLGSLPDLPGVTSVYSHAGVMVYRVANP